MPQTSAVATHADRGKSWMLPEAKTEDLLYVSDGVSGNIFVLSYPGGKQVGEVTGLNEPEGSCVDKAQDVFVVIHGSQHINEYRHGGTKPIARLQDPAGPAGSPLGCTINPITGDLAVTNEIGSSEGSSNYGPPNVAVYGGARGKPTIYADSNLGTFWFCSYDDKGNLFVDATDDSNNTVLVELPKGGKIFANVAIQQTINNPGGVQWDGKYVAVADRTASSGNAVVYRFAVKHGKGVEIGATELDKDDYVISFWIQSRNLIGGNGSDGTLQFWNYPAGGTATKTISGFHNPAAMAVSFASK
jgi:hypothetical protein